MTPDDDDFDWQPYIHNGKYRVDVAPITEANLRYARRRGIGSLHDAEPGRYLRRSSPTPLFRGLIPGLSGYDYQVIPDGWFKADYEAVTE